MNACVCMVGWYFQQELIEKVSGIPELKLYILSHKPQTSIPLWLPRLLLGHQVLFEKNLGYDWGAYQQFIATGLWKDFDTTFFMHDDISLQDDSVFQRGERRFFPERRLSA